MSLIVNDNGIKVADADVLKTRASSKLGWRTQQALMNKMINAVDNPKDFLEKKRDALKAANDAAAASYATTFKDLFESGGLSEEDADRLALQVAQAEYDVRAAVVL